MSQTTDSRIVTFKIIEAKPNKGGIRLTLWRQSVTMKVIPGVGSLPSKDTEKYFMQFADYSGATEITLRMSDYDKRASEFVGEDGLKRKANWLFPKFDSPEDLSVSDKEPAVDNLLPLESE